MGKIDDCEAKFTNYLNLRSDLLHRAATIHAKTAGYQQELKKIDDGLAAMRAAGTAREFSEAINLVASSRFTNSPPVTTAAAVKALRVNDETILRFLLGATNTGDWARLMGEPGRFVPETVKPAERLIVQQLKNDPAISPNHRHYRLWLDADGMQVQDWITVGLFSNTLGWKQIKVWSPSRFPAPSQFRDRDYGYFDGQYRLSPTQLVYRLEDLGNLTETAAFYSVGLEKVLTDNNSYGGPLLEVLDSIKDSHAGSPLFRAWLFARLLDLMQCQPDAWGLDFCPAVREDEVQIEKITNGRSDSGDWFIGRRVNSYANRLEQFFASKETVSYTKQAAGLFALAHTVAQSGLRYVGYVDLAGKPDFVGGSAPGEVLGYSAGHYQRVLLARKAGVPLFQEPVLPLTPLFTLEKSREKLFNEAGVNPEDPCFKNALPPLFQTSPRNQP